MRPFEELTEDERWYEMACACMGCGARRDPLPEEPEVWMCPLCTLEPVRFSSFSCDCLDCESWREKVPPAPVGGTE